MGDGPQDGGPGARVEDGARRGLDTEFAVERAAGVGDDREREIIGVFAQFRGCRMEHDHFADTRGRDLVGTGDERAQVQVAYGAAREAAELQVDQAGRIGDGHLITGDGVQRAPGHGAEQGHGDSS